MFGGPGAAARSAHVAVDLRGLRTASIYKGFHSTFAALWFIQELLLGVGSRRLLRPVRLLRVWISEGLTQADS